METKGERRERIRRNQRKMQVRGRSIFTILRIMGEKAAKARDYVNTQSTANKRRK